MGVTLRSKSNPAKPAGSLRVDYAERYELYGNPPPPPLQTTLKDHWVPKPTIADILRMHQ